MKTACVTSGLTLTMLALSTFSAHGQNLLSNPDFSAGNTGFSTTYTYFTGSPLPEGRYVIEAKPSDHHPLQASFGDHTTGTGLMMVVNGGTLSDWYDWPVWSETVSVDPNSIYFFSGFLTTADSTDGSPADLEVTINGQAVIPDFVSPNQGGTWQQMQAAWTANGASSATISIYNKNTNASGNDFALDDFNFSRTSAVPEPGSCALLATFGLAGVGFLRRCKRRK